MKTQALVTYTVRGVPKEVDAELRRKAARQKKSLNQVIVEELSQSSGRRKKIDLSDVVGKWEPDPAFDEIIASQRKIDWAKWK
jgi:ribosomal protein L18E